MTCSRNLLVILSLLLIQSAIQWRTDRRPKIYGKKLSMKSLYPTTYRLQRRLVRYHNFFRTRVQPPASNMLRMEWSKEAAKDAQSWAQACQFLVHDSEKGRDVKKYGACGQNIFVSTMKVPWFFAVKTWWLEKDNFTYSGTNNLYVIGHYTQMVWASSHQVGCGLAYCNQAHPQPFYNYVCNYCPIGNHLTSLSRPYKRGRPCSDCQHKCRAKKLCTNACHYADQWVNCKELDSAFHNWLCNTRHTKEGLERLSHCRATCLCENKITFPFD